MKIFSLKIINVSGFSSMQIKYKPYFWLLVKATFDVDSFTFGEHIEIAFQSVAKTPHTKKSE